MAGAEATYRSDREASDAKRATILLTSLFVILSLLEANAREARAANPNLLLGGPHVGEFQPVRGDGFLAWQQNTEQTPGHYDVYARPLEGGTKFKANVAGTNGANGDIDGNVLVYQQFKGRRSDLRFFDLIDRDRSSPPEGVNTDQWEYWPSMSGDWLLFARLYGNGVRRIVLFNVATGASRRLASTRGKNAFLAPGQVNGDYAVWYKCSSETNCDVVRYHIPDDTKQTIPNPGSRQRSASVTPDGTVYFARSQGRCGNGVKLVRHPLNGPETVLWRLPGGDDVGSTHAYVSPEGDTTLLYDHFACGQAAESDVWEILEEGVIQLSVTLGGDGTGTITSSPAGIDCAPDCTEIYDLGTGVTLTATPQGNAAFAGWGGACTGTTRTCTLTMDRSKSVTATFSSKPVLSVSKQGTGQGTVMSSPAGINCGTDCNEPYDQGTSVTLTATPNTNSTFAVWGGACSGTSCTVTMNDSKSVTATFNAKPVLTVSLAGDGSGTVTSDDGGINCGAGGTDCTQTYDPGDSVTLTADPASDSAFGEWSGDCSGTSPTCALTMGSDKSVTATFDPLAP